MAETRHGKCAWCGRPITDNGRGRPKKWCGRSCRHRAYQQRQEQERRRPILA